jgi:hypothetical protein
MRDQGWLSFKIADVKYRLDDNTPIEGFASKEGTLEYSKRNKIVD